MRMGSNFARDEFAAEQERIQAEQLAAQLRASAPAPAPAAPPPPAPISGGYGSQYANLPIELRPQQLWTDGVDPYAQASNVGSFYSGTAENSFDFNAVPGHEAFMTYVQPSPDDTPRAVIDYGKLAQWQKDTGNKFMTRQTGSGWEGWLEDPQGSIIQGTNTGSSYADDHFMNTAKLAAALVGGGIASGAIGGGGLGAEAGLGEVATEGAIGQFPSSLGPAIPDVAPIAAGPGVISDFPALLPSLPALPGSVPSGGFMGPPEYGPPGTPDAPVDLPPGTPPASESIDITGQRPPTGGLPSVPPMVVPPTTITEPPGPTTVTEPPGSTKPAPNYGKLLSSLLGNLLSSGGGSGGGSGGYGGSGSSGADKLARSLRQPSEPVTMTNPNYIPR